MIQSFFVKNFRLFKHLEVRNLGQVNLIVGKNNSGKSAFLEAIELFVSDASSNVIIEFLAQRQETWNSQIIGKGPSVESNPVRHLFYGHTLPEWGEDGIKVGSAEGDPNNLHLFVSAFSLERSEDGITRRVPADQRSLFDDWTDLEMALVVESNGKTRRLIPLDKDIATRYGRTSESSNNQMGDSIQVVPTGNMTEEKVAALWDQISLTTLEEEVVSGLQIIEPRITGLTFVEGTKRSLRSGRIPIIKLSGLNEPMPMKSMGDGMTRLLHIVIALVNAQNGILLVDEFENGIHWSVQAKMWRTVFRLAETLNVQIFATTHSQDCVEGFKTAWKERENVGAFFRMGIGKDGESRITPYTVETLSDAMEMDVEVR